MKQLPTNKSPRPDSFTGEFSVQSVKFSRSVMVNSLWPHGLQHARLPCPSPTSRACSNSCPLSLWCHPTISSSIIPFYSCLQSFPVLGSFPMSQFFASGSQSIGASALASVLPKTIQGWSLRIDWFHLLAVQGTFRSLLQHHSLKVSILWCSAFFFYSPALLTLFQVTPLLGLSWNSFPYDKCS